MPIYQHDDLGRSLWGWMTLLNRGSAPRTRGSRTSPSPAGMAVRPLAFARAGCGRQNEAYLLVQRKDPESGSRMEGVKLASPSRLPVVRRLALKGIPLQHVPIPRSLTPSARRSPGTSSSLGEEWRFALRENGVAFYSTPRCEGSKISLFWRKA